MENKTALSNQLYAVYEFECDSSYAGYTRLHLFFNVLMNKTLIWSREGHLHLRGPDTPDTQMGRIASSKT